MCAPNPLLDPHASSHPKEEQTETTEISPQYAPPPSDSNASAGLAQLEEVKSPPSEASSLPVPKPANVEPTDVGPASITPLKTKSNIRIRNQRAGPVAAAMKDPLQTYSQGQGGASSYPTHRPIKGGSERGQPSMEIFRNNYNSPNPPESSIRVLDSLINFVSRVFFNNTSDHDRQECQQLANELSRLKQDIKWHAGEEARLQEKVNILEKNNAKLHERCNKFDDHLKVIQEKSLLHVSTGRWLAQDDLNTYAKLRSLRDQIKSWAVKFSIENLQELDYLRGEDRQEDLAKLNSYLGSIFDGTEAAVAPADISAAKATSIILTAVLAHEMHEKVLGNPFFFLDDGAVQNSQPPGSVFLNVYNQLIRVNATKAHQWRCQMIRTLSEQPRGMDSKTAPLFKFPHQKHAACTQLTNNFLFGPARFLLRNLHDPEEVKVRDQEVFNIWMLAGTLSTDLWTQLPYTQCHYLRELQSAKFHFNSPRVEAHRLYKLEDGDPRLNDRDIVMVIYPAMLASGNVDGEGYDEERVLVKATVWLSREGK